MKSLLSILTIFSAWPLWALNCPIENPQFSNWQSQQSWIQQEVSPSKENPSLSYPVLETQEGELELGALLDGGVVPFKTQMEMNFETPEAQQRFVRRCRDHKIYTPLDENGEASKKGKFKMTLSLLPDLGAEKMSALVASADAFYPSLWLPEESNTKLSAHVSETGADVTRKITDKWTRELQSQIESKTFNGTVELEFNGNQALACDFLKGEYKLYFRFFGKNRSPLVRSDISSKAELEEISTKVLKSKPRNKNLMYFAAGLVVQEAQALEVSTKSVQALEPVLLALFKLTSHETSGMQASQYQCALDQTAKIQENNSDFGYEYKVEIMEGL